MNNYTKLYKLSFLKALPPENVAFKRKISAKIGSQDCRSCVPLYEVFFPFSYATVLI